MRGRRMGRPGLIGTVARTAVVAGTATAVSGGVRRRSAQRGAEQQGADTQQASADQAPAEPAEPPVDKIEKIKELGGLKDSGLLTDEEFASEKAKILAM
jgi:hypothetical protein